MNIGTLKSPNPRNRNSISVIKSKFLSVSSINTLLAILKVTDARRDVILADGLSHRFPWRHLPPPPGTKVYQFELMLILLKSRKLPLYVFASTEKHFFPLCTLLPSIASFLPGGSPYPDINARKIAQKLQEGYRMPKPKHVEIKL